MKPFNIKEYNANPSRKVVTRDGRPVRILCTDARRSYPIVALIEDEGNKEDLLCAYLPDGTMCGMIGDNDLFFAPVKKEGWANIYKNTQRQFSTGIIYNTKEEALRVANHDSIAITKIEWEE